MRYYVRAIAKRVLRSIPSRGTDLVGILADRSRTRHGPWRVCPTSLVYPARFYIDPLLEHAPEVLLGKGRLADRMVVAPTTLSPLAPSLEALHHLNRVGAGLADDESVLTRHAEYISALVDAGGQLRYPSIEMRGVKLRGMPSALSSGFALSALARARVKAGGGAFDASIERLLAGLRLEEEAGGVCRHEAGGPVFFEYPRTGKHALVLNGWLSAVIGILEAADESRNASFVRSVLDALATELPKFEYRLGHRYARDWTRLAGGLYPALVCFQLAHIGLLTAEERWWSVCHRWRAFVDWPHLAREHAGRGAEARLELLFHA